jgi:hypothetical protein
VAVAIVAVGIGGPGCARLKEKQAIRRYAEGAARANVSLRELRALEAVLAEQVRIGQARPLRIFCKERYLPAFARYLDAVRAVPTETADLRRIHGAFVRSLELSYEAHATFVDQVTDESLPTAWTEVARAKQAQILAEERYRSTIAVYYRENDVKLAGE